MKAETCWLEANASLLVFTFHSFIYSLHLSAAKYYDTECEFQKHNVKREHVKQEQNNITVIIEYCYTTGDIIYL